MEEPKVPEMMRRVLLCLLEATKVMRCVLLRMLEAVEGELCLLEVLEMMEVIRCVPLCMLEAVEVGSVRRRWCTMCCSVCWRCSR